MLQNFERLLPANTPPIFTTLCNKIHKYKFYVVNIFCIKFSVLQGLVDPLKTSKEAVSFEWQSELLSIRCCEYQYPKYSLKPLVLLSPRYLMLSLQQGKTTFSLTTCMWVSTKR